ncbi:MAG: transcriptional repressor [Bacteroidales bacterium]|nr:transcriptional repressor [Bacteroidales bacterium]
MKAEKIREKLVSKDLKVTPQRVMVYEALIASREHPTAEKICEVVRKTNPNIAIGTIYNILDTFVEKALVNRVKTDREKMRYDAFLENHHHLYDVESEKITDLYDDELSTLIEDYLQKKGIPDFSIENVKLQISGRYKG